MAFGRESSILSARTTEASCLLYFPAFNFRETAYRSSDIVSVVTPVYSNHTPDHAVLRDTMNPSILRTSPLRFYWKVIVFQTIGIFLLSIFSVQGKDFAVNEVDAKRFADFLYRNGEYYRAISEYKRLIYFFPESLYREEAIFQIGRSYMAGGDLESAILYWNQILQEPTLKDVNLSGVHLLLSISYLDKDRLKPFQLRVDNINKALYHLDQIDSQFSDAEQGHSFASDWRSRSRPDYKSPLLAGGLSTMVPGAGSFYAERYREGLYTFLITAFFYVAALEAFHKEEKELAFVFGSFAVAFYGGGIYTAVNSVYKLNDRMDADALHDIRKKNGFWFIPETDRFEGRF